MKGLASDWRGNSQRTWEVPYGALLPREVGGLLTAGRCLSNEPDAWEVLRAIPNAALTGEVCGVAAALAIDSGITPERLPVARLQQALRARGFVLHLSELHG